ncbi:TM2 domain-containing protein [Arthrobacter sp. UCD-GKA]|uniref:TM2 domain-containing protein n=1 Tax=Arthrobacter sp. UCD-GKA TaxID=1913576 RepID=UPI0009F37F36|nr:TM2 domain-containing protein [Arthrobacter sp. UCD-GKA]
MSTENPPNSSDYPARPVPQAIPEPPAQPQAQNINITNTVVLVNSKSTGVAYVLWFFLGQLGIHKFYLNQTGMGVLYLVLGVVGWATTFLFVGFLILGVLWLLMIVDLFLIPGRVNQLNSRAMQS